MPDADLGDDVERPAAGQAHGQLGERLEAAAEARGRPADALGDGLELAAGRRDERQDPVGLAQVEPGQDDRLGRVAARDGHRRDGTTATSTRVIRSPRPRVCAGRRRCGRVPRAGVEPVLGARSPRDRRSVPSTGYLQRTRFVYTRATMTATLPGDRPRRPHRRHRGRDRPPRPGSRSVDARAVRDGPLPPRAGRVRRVGRQADPAAPRPARLRQHHRRPPARAAGRRGRGTGAQLQPRPRRHRGRRHRAPPPPHPLDGPRHPAGDQHRRHAVQPVAHRPPPPDRPRLPGRQGAAPHAPVRRDLPGPVRGPVHRHRSPAPRTS